MRRGVTLVALLFWIRESIDDEITRLDRRRK